MAGLKVKGHRSNSQQIAAQYMDDRFAVKWNLQVDLGGKHYLCQCQSNFQERYVQMKGHYKPLLWSGGIYSLQICRHWQTFFGLVTIFEISKPRMKKLLPQSQGEYIANLYAIVSDAKNDFSSFDDWWRVSKKLCDDYCDDAIMGRTRSDNFYLGTDDYTVATEQALALGVIQSSTKGANDR